MTDHLFTGSLADYPLPEILQTLCDYQVPGTLTCETTGQERRIHFLDGKVTGVETIAPPESFIAYLRRRNGLTQSQADKAMEWITAGHGSEASVLVAIGALSPGALDLAQREWIAAQLLPIFDWADGAARVSLGPPPPGAQSAAAVPLTELILEGIRKLADAKRALQSVGHKDTILEPAESAFQRLDKLTLNRDELRLLRLCDGTRSFYEMVQAGVTGGMTQGAAVKAIYALLVLKLVMRKVGAVKMRV